MQQLKEENQQLLVQKAEFEKLKADNKALRDQFQTASPPSVNLLPARIIGISQFIPGITSFDQIILDKGSAEGVRLGYAVADGQNLLGKVTDISFHRCQVELVSNKNFSFTAQTAETNASGVIKGQGGGDILLDNVLLSGALKISDVVVTKGDQTIEGIGLPPDLIVGKIVSIDKKASSLFQSAKIKSPVDIASLSLIFIIFPQ